MFDSVSSLTEIMWRRKQILPQRKPPQQPPCWGRHILPQRKPPQQPPCWGKHILPQRKPSCQRKPDPTPKIPHQPPCWGKHILPQRKPPQQPPCWRKHILPQRKSDPTALSSKFWSPNMVLDQKMVNYKCEVLQRTTKNLQILFCWFLKEQSCCFWYICQVWFLC